MMDFHDRHAFIQSVHGVILGIDVGLKTLGLAISDQKWRIASPLKTLKRTRWKQDRLLLEEVVHAHQVKGMVIGWPRLMNGDESRRCTSTQHIAENIYQAFALPCLMWDERLSTTASLSMLEKEADLSRQKRAEVVDHVAASLILQGALDALNRLKNDWDGTS